MLTVGIDVGIENIKAVVLKDGEVIGRAFGDSGGADRSANIQAVYAELLESAGIKGEEVEGVISTGKGKFDVSFSDDQLSEVVVASAAAKRFEQDVTTLVDIGADEIIVATISGDDVTEFVLNQKCAAGLGLLLENMADRFGVSQEELGSLDGQSSVTVNDGCVVFAELDALSLVNRGADKKEVLKALVDACVWRANTTLNDIYKPKNDCVVLMGGMSKNTAFVKKLEKLSGINFIIPEDACYGGAIGAAVLATTLR